MSHDVTDFTETNGVNETLRVYCSKAARPREHQQTVGAESMKPMPALCDLHQWQYNPPKWHGSCNYIKPGICSNLNGQGFRNTSTHLGRNVQPKRWVPLCVVLKYCASFYTDLDRVPMVSRACFASTLQQAASRSGIPASTAVRFPLFVM